MLDLSKAKYNGPEYNPDVDDVRLRPQTQRVYDAMKDGVWRAIHEISSITGDPEMSVSAQLRHLRKEKFGSHTVERRVRKYPLFEYKLIPNIGDSDE